MSNRPSSLWGNVAPSTTCARVSPGAPVSSRNSPRGATTTSGWSTCTTSAARSGRTFLRFSGKPLRTGLFKWSRGDRPQIGLQEFREDPDKSPLSTPSGKIEIFSGRLWNLARSVGAAGRRCDQRPSGVPRNLGYAWGSLASSDRGHTSSRLDQEECLPSAEGGMSPAIISAAIDRSSP